MTKTINKNTFTFHVSINACHVKVTCSDMHGVDTMLDKVFDSEVEAEAEFETIINDLNN